MTGGREQRSGWHFSLFWSMFRENAAATLIGTSVKVNDMEQLISACWLWLGAEKISHPTDVHNINTEMRRHVGKKFHESCLQAVHASQNCGKNLVWKIIYCFWFTRVKANECRSAMKVAKRHAPVPYKTSSTANWMLKYCLSMLIQVKKALSLNRPCTSLILSYFWAVNNRHCPLYGRRAVVLHKFIT